MCRCCWRRLGIVLIGGAESLKGEWHTRGGDTKMWEGVSSRFALKGKGCVGLDGLLLCSRDGWW